MVGGGGGVVCGGGGGVRGGGGGGPGGGGGGGWGRGGGHCPPKTRAVDLYSGKTPHCYACGVCGQRLTDCMQRI